MVLDFDKSIAIGLSKTFELEIPPLQKWPSSVASQEKEQGNADDRDQVERQDQHKLNDLAERKRSKDGSLVALAQCDQRTQLIALVYLSDSRDQISQALMDQDGVKTVDLRMVYEPSLEKYRDDEICFGKNEDRSVKPCRLALKDSQ